MSSKVRPVFFLFLFHAVLSACGQSSGSGTTGHSSFGNEPNLFPEGSGINLSASSLYGINLDPKVSQDHREKMIRSLEYLAQSNFDETSPSGIELMRILGVSDLKGKTLITWVNDGIQLILDPNTWGGSISDLYGINWDFPTTRPELNKFNIGTGFSIPFPSGGVRAPGVITLYPKLLDSEHNDIRNISYSRAIYLLGTIFHERRHSDGNKLNSSHRFPHQYCSSAHPHAGKLVCDSYSNGSTAVAFYFMKAALENCKECSKFGKDMLRIALIDAKLRFDPKNLVGDVNPEIYP